MSVYVLQQICGGGALLVMLVPITIIVRAWRSKGKESD